MAAQSRTLTPRLVIQLLIVIVLIPFLPLLITRRRGWWEAWAYALTSIFGFIVSRVLAARRHPDLLRERSRMTDHADMKPWDKVLAPLMALGGGLVPLVAGLDKRFGWSRSFSLPAKALALAAIIGGYALGTYALLENRFFSGVVRIQSDRDHHVVTTGPYRWLRHPGYAGALLVYATTPILLDSWWSLTLSALLAIVTVIRTYLEDTTLQDELEGYREYAASVRYRLFPGLW